MQGALVVLKHFVLLKSIYIEFLERLKKGKYEDLPAEMFKPSPENTLYVYGVRKKKRLGPAKPFYDCTLSNILFANLTYKDIRDVI